MSEKRKKKKKEIINSFLNKEVQYLCMCSQGEDLLAKKHAENLGQRLGACSENRMNDPSGKLIFLQIIDGLQLRKRAQDKEGLYC